jgi:low temperature requirement protein LtrA
MKTRDGNRTRAYAGSAVVIRPFIRPSYPVRDNARVMAQHREGPGRIRAVRRDGEQVTPLELFFDLVFVLALTQCTAVIAEHPTWTGVGEGLLVLALLWWAWVGYAWLTSVVDPEEGGVRLSIFAAMAAFLIAALAVPDAFGDDAIALAVAYAVVRLAHVALFMLASRGESELRHSVVGFAGSTGLGVVLVLVGAFADDGARAAIWAVAILVDVGGPYFFGTSGWQLVPAHFAERHGLIIIIALGESIVAIGVGAGVNLTAEVIVGAILGVLLASGLWWLYFDVTSIMAARRLSSMPPGRDRNALARDAYSYLHFPMVAGIVLAAFALKTTLSHVDHQLHLVPASALAGGVALFLLAQLAFKHRTVGTWSAHRLVTSAILVALIPLLTEVHAVVALGIVVAVIALHIGYESVRFAELRREERAHLHEHHQPPDPADPP